MLHKIQKCIKLVKTFLPSKKDISFHVILEIQYIVSPLRHFQWHLVSKHLYDLVFLSIACLVTCMHIILFRHNLNFHFYYQARYTLSKFIVSPPLLVIFNYFVLQNFGLISMHICSLTLFTFKIVLRTFPVKFT